MYWKTKTSEINGVEYRTYKYFRLKPNHYLTSPFYNSLTKEISYPARYELIIDERIERTEEEFLQWYKTNIKY